jgi:hypothetical protein
MTPYEKKMPELRISGLGPNFNSDSPRGNILESRRSAPGSGSHGPWQCPDAHQKMRTWPGPHHHGGKAHRRGDRERIEAKIRTVLLTDKGSNDRVCRLALVSLDPDCRDRSATPSVPIRYRTDINPLPHRYRSATAPIPIRTPTATNSLAHQSRFAIAPMQIRHHTNASPLRHLLPIRYRTNANSVSAPAQLRFRRQSKFEGAGTTRPQSDPGRTPGGRSET